jgi:hypothetical protein
MRIEWAGWLVAISAPVLYSHPPDLILSTQQIQFQTTVSAPNPPSQLFILTNGTHADMQWSAQISSASGGQWLSMFPPGGATADGAENAYTQVSVSAAGLKPGVYTGTITITASRLYLGVVYPATHSPQSATVTLTVAADASPIVKVSTNVLTVQGVAGVGPASRVPVAVTNAGSGNLAWTAAAQASTGTGWLAVSPSSGLNSGTITITADPSSLAQGVYNGSVTVSAAGSVPTVIAVTFTLRDQTPPSLQLANQPLNFFVVAGGSSPPAQRIAITNSGEKALNWQVTSSTFNGGAWL